MSYEQDPTLPGPDTVRAVAREQIDHASCQLLEQPDGHDHALHELRKSCKRLRALIRLVREDLGAAYRHENKALRDIARPFSELRDVVVAVQTFDGLAKPTEHFETSRFQPIRARLVARGEEVREACDLSASIERALSDLQEAADRVNDWPVTDQPKTLRAGLKRTYARGVQAFRAAAKHGDVETFHEWRKQSKYHRYHMRLVSEAWEPILKKQRSEVKRLSSMLGFEHDLAMVEQHIAANPQACGEAGHRLGIPRSRRSPAPRVAKIHAHPRSARLR